MFDAPYRGPATAFGQMFVCGLGGPAGKMGCKSWDGTFSPRSETGADGPLHGNKRFHKMKHDRQQLIGARRRSLRVTTTTTTTPSSPTPASPTVFRMQAWRWPAATASSPKGQR
ncbi:hypothetical protein G3M48_009551 [Beauveria asiatica]|uniref:Uncharacterized protein n=1 Tax=Beauveria asiatica TaxID=1069075 RepID=A0AAW0RJ03_9HYPO